MRFSTKQLLLLTSIIAVVIVLGRPFYLEITRPEDCTYVMAASKSPGVNGYTFLDADQNVRVVVLEKITRTPRGRRGRNTEPEWLDYSISGNRKIHLKINGSPVYFSKQIVVYYAVDGGVPKRIDVPIKSIRDYEFPHELWDRLIEKNMDEPSDAPKSPIGRKSES